MCSKVQFVVEVVVKVAKVMLLAMMMMRDFVFYREKRFFKRTLHSAASTGPH